MHIVKRDFHGREFSLESGKVAKQANGSIMARMGDTTVLITVGMGDEKDADFFPLSCDYIEKTYAAGKIPGGYFKREGKLSEHETLTSRIIDRPIRPLFPEGMRREVQVIATVLSADANNEPDVVALCGASAALTVSDIPFEGPVAGVRVGRVNGKLIINPSLEEREQSDMNFFVAGSRDAIVMVEGGAKEVSEDEVLEALYYAHSEMQALIDMQSELGGQCGLAKVEIKVPQIAPEVLEKVQQFCAGKIEAAMTIQVKHERKEALSKLKEEMLEALVNPEDEEADSKTAEIKGAFSEYHYDAVRNYMLKNKIRIDGRDSKTVRKIDIETTLLPRAHGSALFTRGETQAIVVATLGTATEAQRIDSLLGEEEKHFMLHYNFPPFSVGEVRFLRGPGRREIGHGALAERAIRAVVPSADEFPYVIRVVSEITESNGSSSMASVCGASLSLMDAGVPIKAPVAGVAMGLIESGSDYMILTDILGDEDHLGDMDFKVCGTEKGITALQMDIKIKGLKKEIMVEAMNQAREGRLHILEKMNEVISKSRTELSEFAPRVTTFKISTDKIRDLIGPGGKTIRSITESFGVKIEVQDDGTVSLFSSDRDKTEEALKVIKALTEEAEVGKIYTGVVKKITDFGAFVEILPGTSGLLHISQISDDRVEEVTDVLSEGEQVPVKVLEVDRQGKIRLSRKEALEELAH
ncbi:MAG: polyribonucleotide nucleotidyltransferase [Deltaproteobacteria bacterium]|nr:polyribonucleotide nucleotidyltransferase [Deltaproteobacteria bacterium]